MRERDKITAIMEPLTPRHRKKIFWWLSRIAGLLAVLCILTGLVADLANRDIGLNSTTWMLLGLYVIGVQVYFLLAYFVETGGIE